MSRLNDFRKKIANFISPPAPQKRQQRMYAAAQTSRSTQSAWGISKTSADAELSTSLNQLRGKSRALIRDASYAKRAKVIIVNNIVGMGIGLQAQVKTSRDQLKENVNSDIEAAWSEWCRAKICHTGGSLHFCDLERLAMGQIFEAGEVFIRKHYRPFGDGRIPFTLEVIEPERIADEYQPGSMYPGRNIKMGIEVDDYYRPQAYWIRTLHPGEIRSNAYQTDRVERVPASQIFHLRIIDRWPQTRGVPWLHTAASKLNDMDGYSEAEIVAARGAAAYMGIIESGEEYGDTQEDGSKEISLEPGMIEKLDPGERFNFVSPNRPNAQMDPFMRLMLREIAAGTNCSYESLSRDYSQSNYSSSRLALIDDRDLWRTLQMWFIQSFRAELHREWLQQAILSRVITSISIDEYAVNPSKFEAVRFKPRGWSWIDPTKEVEAYKEAIRGGFMTVGEVVSLTGGGRDIEDVLTEREQELKMMKEKGLSFDTEAEKEVKQAITKQEGPEGDEGQMKKILPFRRRDYE